MEIKILIWTCVTILSIIVLIVICKITSIQHKEEKRKTILRSRVSVDIFEAREEEYALLRDLYTIVQKTPDHRKALKINSEIMKLLLECDGLLNAAVAFIRNNNPDEADKNLSEADKVVEKMRRLKDENKTPHQ